MQTPKLFIRCAALIILLLAACASPQAVPQNQAASPTPEPPKASVTPLPPSAAPAPSWNVVQGARITLGPVEMIVTKVAEAQMTPVTGKSPQAGMKFILIEMDFASQDVQTEFDSTKLVLKTSTGAQFSPFRVYGTDGMGGNFEAGSVNYTGGIPQKAFNLLFEVPVDVNLAELLLTYD